MMELGIGIFLAAVVLVAAGGIFIWNIKKKVRNFSREVFGTDSLQEGFKKQEEELAETPKSVSGMTNIYQPQIERDFPELSVRELMRKGETQLKEVLEALEKQEISPMTQAGADLKRQIELWIEDLKEQGIRERFQNVVIHKTAISRYTKSAGCCTIIMQSAVEYQYSRWKKGEDAVGQPERKQTRYEMEWIYIQDLDKMPQYSNSLAMNCPNCGAVITNLGNKVCEYCGSAVEAINLRVWALHHIKEI